MITSLINEHPKVVLTIYRGLSRTHDLQEEIIGIIRISIYVESMHLNFS